MVLAILQARMSSTRLPGKVLLPILGEPMLGRQIERLGRAKRLTRLVVATSTGAEDDAIANYCERAGVACFRGDLDDVLSRVLGAIQAFGPADTVVRLTADCPLTDPTLIDHAVASHVEAAADYTSVSLGWTFPKGLDVEVCQASALETAGREAIGADREHVTAFLYASTQTSANRFRINAITRDPPLRYRWTVDTPQDFAFVTGVYEALYPANPDFTTQDVLAWQGLHPDRVLINDVSVAA